MDLNLLKYFIAVADEMSFSSAAESIYLSQSSLSKHVKRLEDELGFQLFSRNSHTTELTPAGEALLPAARNIVRELDIVHDQLRMWSSQRCLRLASFSFFSIYHLDRFISKFISLNGMDISLVENASDSLLAMLDGDAIDAYFAFEYGNFPPESYVCYPILSEELVLATTSPVAQLSPDGITLDELRGFDIVTLSERDEPFMTGYLQKYAPELAARIEPRNIWLYSLKSVIKKEACASIIPRMVAQSSKLCCTPILGLPQFNLALITKPDRITNNRLAALKQYMNQELTEW